MNIVKILLTVFVAMTIWNAASAQESQNVVVGIHGGELKVTTTKGNTTRIVQIKMDSLIVTELLTQDSLEDVEKSVGIYSLEGLNEEVIARINSKFHQDLKIEDDVVIIPDGSGDNLEVKIGKMDRDVRGSQEKKQSYKESGSTENVKVVSSKSSYPNVKTRWLLLKVGFNSYVQEGSPRLDDGVNPTDLKVWPSLNWGIELFQTRFNLINHYVNIKTGLGFDFNYYEFKNHVSLVEGTQSVEWSRFSQPNNTAVEYDRNSLSAAYMKIPLMLNFESNPGKKSQSFRMNAGVYGGLKIHSRLRQKWSNKKYVVKDDFNLTDWTYGLTGSIGYGAFNIYMDYSLVGLFKSDRDSGYVLTPFSIGLQLTPF